MKPARLPHRFIASMIDLAIVSMIWFFACILMVFFAGRLFPAFFENLNEELLTGSIPPGFLVLIFMVVILFSTIFHSYFISMESASGQTVGKRMMRIKVVSIDGSAITKKQAISRDFSKMYFELMLTIPLLYIFMNENRQRLGDKWAKTIVIEHLQ